MSRKRIAVFDAQPKDCSHTAQIVQSYFAEHGTPADVVEFTSPKMFAGNFKVSMDAGTPYDMSFIGVDSVMGMETARNIRELDLTQPIFLVSDVSDYGLEGFRLHVLDYLIKPVSSIRVKEAVRRIGMKCQPGGY
jgi:DNA-binding LytR/AlgR family response regulator